MKKTKKDERRIVTHTVTIEFKSCGSQRLTNRELKSISYVEIGDGCWGAVAKDRIPAKGDFAVITSVHAKAD